jgi:hypothetical protein
MSHKFGPICGHVREANFGETPFYEIWCIKEVEWMG